MIKGFIRKMEDAGDEYYNDLLWMGFFQIVGKCDDTCTTVIKMHDLIHDLAQLIAGKRVMELVSPNSLQSYFLLQKCGNFAHVRHASVICNFRSLGMPQLLYTAKKLRSLNLMSPQDVSEEALSTVFTKFRQLRVLDLSGCNIQNMQTSIGD